MTTTAVFTRLLPTGLTAAALLAAAWLTNAPPARAQSDPAASGRAIRHHVMGPRRVALVVGNNAYPRRPLRNARADAEAMTERLRALDFDVRPVYDATLPELEQEIDGFVGRLRDADVALFFYSGHGFEIDGSNYLVPVDFVLGDRADARYTTYDASRLRDRMENSGAALRILILDACRDNPFAGPGKSLTPGLAAMYGGGGTYVVFATSPGKIADDNWGGRNGLFTKHLLEVMASPTLELDELFEEVQARVFKESDGKQLPWIHENVVGKFYFRPPQTVVPPPLVIADGRFAGLEQPALPPTTTAAVGELWSEARKLAAAKKAWEQRLAAMQTSFREAEDYERTDVGRPLKAEYWRRFLDAYPEENPYSATDEELRERAAARLAFWEKVVEIRNPREIAVLQGHSSSVKSVSWSPDGRTLAAGTSDNDVVIWDIDKRKKVSIHGRASWGDPSMSWSPDGRTLASIFRDGNVVLWDVNSRQKTATLGGDSEKIISMSWIPDGRTLAFGNRDREVVLWDIDSRRRFATLEGHSGWVESVSWSPVGRTLASGSAGNVALWNIDNREKITTLKGHSAKVTSVSWSPDGRTLASGAHDNAVVIWDIDTRKQIVKLQGHFSAVSLVSWSPDGRTLVSRSHDKTVVIWDVYTSKSKKGITTLEGHSAKVSSVSWSPDGRTLVFGTDDNTVVLWGINGRKRIATLEGHSAEVTSVSWSPDGRTLASGSEDDTVRLWSVTDGE
ncbi:MAG: hypothetical protein GY851_28060 [bacterium]|nr:hypothetical protein [bacterium]